MAINILSVDFDWLMDPSIEIYNDSLNINMTVDDLLKISPGVNCEFNYQNYYKLYLLLYDICKNINDNSRILIFDNHHDIITCIEDMWQINEPYNLYNIDHHHDCGYPDPIAPNVYEQDLNSGNWVQWCKNLNSYIWINNTNSALLTNPELIKNIPNYQYTSDLQLITYLHFDYVFICLSPEWIPKKYVNLFEVFIHAIHHIAGEESQC